MTEKKNSNLLILKATSSDIDDCDCSFAILNLSKGYRDQLLKAMNTVAQLKEEDSDVFRLEIWDGYQVKYLSDTSSADFDAIYELFEQNNSAQTVQVDELPFEQDVFLSIDAPTALIEPNEVKFTCFVRHSDTELRAGSITKQQLESMEFEDE